MNFTVKKESSTVSESDLYTFFFVVILEIVCFCRHQCPNLIKAEKEAKSEQDKNLENQNSYIFNITITCNSDSSIFISLSLSYIKIFYQNRPYFFLSFFLNIYLVWKFQARNKMKLKPDKKNWRIWMTLNFFSVSTFHSR